MKYREEIPVAHSFPYKAMSLQARKKMLPKRNVCSLYPAVRPDDRLITGNGRHRIAVNGDPYDEWLTFTQELLYEPRWAKTPEPPDFTGVMPAIRRLLLENKFEEAGELAEQTRLNDENYAPWKEEQEKSIYPVGSLHTHDAFYLEIRQPQQGETREYLRWLDMMTGCVTVQWNNGLGSFRREAVTSYNGDINVLRLTGDAKNGIDADFVFVSPKTYSGMTKKASGMHRGLLEAPDKCTEEIRIDGDTIILETAYYPAYGQKGYSAVIRLIPKGGKLEVIESGLRVTGAESVEVLSKVVKYEGGFHFHCSDDIVREVKGFSHSFEDVLAFNRGYLGERMDRSRIQISGCGDFALSSEELFQRMHTEEELDPALLEKLYDMGRFYQITDTGELPPFWGQHNINTNLQVCSGNNTGLFDEMDVYFRYYETKFDDFRTNARKLFGARGLLASIHCDYDSGLYYHFSKTYPHYCWTGCLGWIYNEFWGYYLITGDEKFLAKRIVPALKEIALFFEDYACDKDENGHSIFYPSFSPENPTPVYAGAEYTYATRINSVMDIMICREVLDNLIYACEVLKIEQENIPHWQAQRDALPVYLLDEEGGLKEWAWPSVPENFNQRHVSHHYDLWPGHYITWEEQPKMARAIQISNRKRSHQDDSAHGIIHRVLSAIRLKDKEEMEQSLSVLMNHGFVTRALSTRHFPYYAPFPDLQGAMPAILLEMCIYSAPGVIEFLPALPSSLRTGTLKGIWLYTWAKLECIDWDEKGFRAELVSNKKQSVTLRLRKKASSFMVNGKKYSLDGDHIQYLLEENERIIVEAEYR
ncbi:MAG: glycosyl hydrolase family 95 catalytic domain-containing protein [Hydrogeniiclostridium sp.]